MAVIIQNEYDGAVGKKVTVFTLTGVTVPTSSDRAIYVLIGASQKSNNGGLFPSGVTFNGSENFVLVGQGQNNKPTVSVWRLLAPTETTADIVVTWPTNNGVWNAGAVGVQVLSDVNQSTPNATWESPSTGSSTAPAHTVTADSGDYVVDIVAALAPTAGPTENGDGTVIWAYQSQTPGMGSADIQATGSPAMAWTLASSTDWIHGGVAVIAAGVGQTFNLSVDGSLTITGIALGKVVGKALAGSMTATGSSFRDILFNISGSLTAAGALARDTLINLAGSIAASGLMTSLKLFTLALSGGLSAAGSLTRLVSITVSGAVTGIAGAVSDSMLKLLTGSVTATGTIATIRLILKSLAGSIAATGSFASLQSILKAVGGSIAATGSITKDSFLALAGSVSAAGLITKDVFVTLVGSIAATGVAFKLSFQQLVGSLTPTGAIATAVVLLVSLTGSLTAAAAVLKATSIRMDGSTAGTGDMAKIPQKVFGGSITGTGDGLKDINKELDGSLTPEGEGVPTLSLTQAVSGALTALGALVALFVSPPSLSDAITNIRGWYGRLGR